MSDRLRSPGPPPATGPVQYHLDGTRIERFEIDCSEARLFAVLQDIFESHWDEVVFGPCIEGAVFEGRFAQRPSVSLLDGYVTVQVEGSESWHFHLCIGPHGGSAALPTPPELAAWRRCARAAFFINRDRAGRPSAWGFRMWNGRGEQMITIFFPNPWIDPGRRQYVDTPDWSRLELWMTLREKWAAIPAEPPPAGADRPRTH